MANYIFLMQLQNESSLSVSQEDTMVRMSVIGSGVSMVGSVMTLCLLCFLPIGGDGLFIVGNMCVVLSGAQLAFIGSENTAYPDPILCKCATAVLQYMFLGVHFSSLSYGLHLLSKLRPQVVGKNKRRHYHVAMIWGVPLVIVAITAVIRGDTYAKHSLCWLTVENGTRLAFIVPVLGIVLFNVLIFILIIATRAYVDIKKDQPKSVLIKNMVLTGLSLIPTLGLSWIFGFAVTLDTAVGLQYLYVLLSSCQGMLILVLHVLPSSHVRKVICAKARESVAANDSDTSYSRSFTLFSNFDDKNKTTGTKEEALD